MRSGFRHVLLCSLRWVSLRCVTLSAACALAACGGGGAGSAAIQTAPTASGSPQPSGPNAIPAPSAAIYLGAWVLAAGAPTTSSAQDIAALETAIGRKFAISMHYDGFTDPFPSAAEAADAQNGRTPLISLNCDDTDYNIANGSQDAALIAKANSIKAFGHPVFLRYNWEFNLTDTSNGRYQCVDPVRDIGGYFSPTQYIAAYVHIHNVMVAHGATNIAWIWNPAAGGVDATPYFPGDAYVDWVGIDDYDRNATQTAIFAQPYAQYASIGNGTHPVIVAETGALADDQVSFLDVAMTALPTEYPKIKAFVYFDAVGALDDYTLSPAGLRAFALLAADPYFGATIP